MPVNYQMTWDSALRPSYGTNFPLTETSISEGGRWRGGLTDGGSWHDIRTAAGIAYGTQLSGPTSGPPYDDSMACLSDFPPDHSASVIVNIDPAGNVGLFHEAELLLRWDISPGVARGYECNYAYNGAYSQIAIWNGPQNSFGTFVDPGDPNGALQTGDVLLATAIGNVISMYRNGVLTCQLIDTSGAGGGAKWTDGNPGLGQWRRNGSGLPPRIRYTHYEAHSL